MNNLINRDYHEAIGKVIKVEINNDLQLGNSLLHRIPYNMVGEMENQKIQKESRYAAKTPIEKLAIVTPFKARPTRGGNRAASRAKLQSSQFEVQSSKIACLNFSLPSFFADGHTVSNAPDLF